MGEIATWSAVKTKVGLGKDSNECPTKAELLALSPTGTGESYIGLEISNASSYGDNETVQLSDIHKVTYRYTFTLENSILNFPAAGGVATPPRINITSTKTKYVDGVATSEVTNIDREEPVYPSWVRYNGDLGRLIAQENTNTESRTDTITYIQKESGKQLIVTVNQAAGTETWEYLFSVTNSTMEYEAIGGTSITGNGYIGVYSKKQRYINGNADGGLIDVEYSGASFPSWLSYNSDNKTQVSENKSESTREFIQKVTQAESGKTLNVTFSQAAGVKTYGDITITPTSEIADISAAGGTSGIFTYSYSQPWGWNGKTTDGGTITSGATASWSNAVSGSNLGTTAKARTKLGTRTLTLTQNGKSSTATKDVYQAENKIVSTSQGVWVVSISANPSTFTEQGGTSQISASARAPRTNTWSSGATNAASDATGTPTLSIPTAVTGFSLSGTTLTVAENTTSNDRSVVVRATMDTVYKEVTVTQSAYLVEWKYYLTTSTPTLNFDAIGTTKFGTISSYREKYINGSLVEGSHEGVNILVKSMSAEIQSATGAVAITMKENTVASERTGTVVYEQISSGKTVTITCKQAAGTVSTRNVLELVVDLNSTTSAKGGSDYATVKSGYYDVINGKDTTFHTVVPTIASKSPAFTNVDITIDSSTTCKISVEVAENTDESSRTVSLTLNRGSEQLSLRTTQSGASVGWSYELKVNNGAQDLNQQVPAKPNGTYTFTISSKRYKIINGSVTSQSEDTTWTTSIPGSPSWVHVEENGNTLIVSVDENTTTSKRSADITIFQTGSGDTSITLTVEQQAATITTRDFIDYVEPIPGGDFNAENQGRSIYIISYKETLVNDTVTNKIGVEPTWELDLLDGSNWASLASLGTSPSNPYEFEIELTVEENTTNQTRNGTVMFKNGTAEVENAFGFTQDAATISTRYEIFWRLSNADGNTDRVTEIELNGSVGSDAIDMIVIMNKITSINGNETSTPIGTYTEDNLLRLSGGNINVQLGSYSRGIVGIFDLGFQLQTLQDNLEVGAYTVSASLIGGIKDGNVEVGKAPDFTIKVLPVPYQRILEFGWKSEGSTTTNITLNGDRMTSESIASRDINSYVSLRRNGVEFARNYIKPTFIPPSEDWLQVIDNEQNSDQTWNWVFRALTDNEGKSARSQSVRFEQPGNGNQALYAYVSQDPKSVPTYLNVDLYNTYNATNNLQVRISWQGSTLEGGQIGDNLVISQGGYLGAYTGLNEGNLYAQFKGKPGAGIDSSMYVSLQNLQLESGSESEGNYKKVPLTIGPSGGSYDIQWGSFSMDNDAFNCRIADYGLNTEGGFIYFVVEKTNTSVSVLEGAKIGSIPLYLNPNNVEGFNGMFGTINIDFFYGMI